MRVIILGSAAGGGVPQWNCACPNCSDARHDNRGRTQSSVAVSADGERWILLNASPDLRTQLAAHHELWPMGGGQRGSSIAVVILTDGEIDHTLGLLLMRESASRLPVYAPGGVTALLDDAWPLPPHARWGTCRWARPGAAWSSCRGSAPSARCSCTSTTPILCCAAARPSARRSRRRASRWEKTRWRSSCERAANEQVTRRVGAPLPPSASVQSADALRRAVARGAAALGGEPLLLPDQYSGERRADPRQLPGARGTPAVDPAHHRSRRAPR